ncbi:MAG: DoxX family protein [Bacteroidetes bacterium HGW-Bacteroidetes-22]|nr:MAG: DoxX family protein [Bacteroidetes bacterium HGW-Bacteroidetes-22]
MQKLTTVYSPVWAQSVGLLLIRLGFGFMMLLGHGWIKGMNFGLMSSSFPDPLGVGHATSILLAVFAEVVCSVLVITGLFTRAALIPLVVTMLVAFFSVHGGDPFAVRELSMVYLLVFITLFLAGPGRYSIDHYLQRKLIKQKS